MATIVLLHSILGLRSAERRIADTWEVYGHSVVLPDLFDGKTTESYEQGFALKATIGEPALLSRAFAATDDLPGNLVLAGVSFGAFLIGEIWRRRPDLAGVVLLSGAAPWMKPRRAGLPVSAHIARPDPFDDEAYFRQWADEAGPVDLTLHRYDGAGHYFLDGTLEDYDARAAALCLDRTREFLASLQ